MDHTKAGEKVQPPGLPEARTVAELKASWCGGSATTPPRMPTGVHPTPAEALKLFSHLHHRLNEVIFFSNYEKCHTYILKEWHNEQLIFSHLLYRSLPISQGEFLLLPPLVSSTMPQCLCTCCTLCLEQPMLYSSSITAFHISVVPIEEWTVSPLYF